MRTQTHTHVRTYTLYPKHGLLLSVYRAKTEREEAIESGDLDSFQLSNENMDWLNNMHNNLNVSTTTST